MKNLVLLSFILLTGCSSLVYDKEKIYINSDVSLDLINVVTSKRERDSQTFVQIRGVPSSDQTVYYKIDWFDMNGMKISTPLSQWKRVNLIEDVDFVWKIPAPSKSVVSYKVYITENIGNGIIE